MVPIQKSASEGHVPHIPVRYSVFPRTMVDPSVVGLGFTVVAVQSELRHPFFYRGAKTAQELLPNGGVYVLPPNKTVEVTIPGGAAGFPVSLWFNLRNGIHAK